MLFRSTILEDQGFLDGTFNTDYLERVLLPEWKRGNSPGERAVRFFLDISQVKVQGSLKGGRLVIVAGHFHIDAQDLLIRALFRKQLQVLVVVLPCVGAQGLIGIQPAVKSGVVEEALFVKDRNAV